MMKIKNYIDGNLFYYIDYGQIPFTSGKNYGIENEYLHFHL